MTLTTRLAEHRFYLLSAVGFLSSVLLFVLWPHLDLYVAALFYDGQAFHFRESLWVKSIYWLFAKIQILYLLIIIYAIVQSSLKKKWDWRKRWWFMFACLILGPGLLVNTILKDNSLGRPRPLHTDVFGGQHQFVPAFHYSGICKKNCSFVSGHAAIGFYTMALAWLLGRRRWIYLGLGVGLLVGAIRILQGGHFLSDVLFAGWFTFFLYWLLARAFGLDKLSRS